MDLKTQSRNVDFSGAHSTKPFKTGTTLPATCITGEFYFKTDATPGKNLYGCSSGNVWSLMTSLQDLPAVWGSGKVLSNDGATPAWKSLGGDITGSPESVTVNRIQGRSLTGAPPQDSQILKWRSVTNQWELDGAASHQHTVTDLQGVTGRNGNGSLIQMSGGGPMSAGDCAKFDATGNLVSNGGPCVAGLSNFSQSFTSQTTVVLTHNMNSTAVVVQCFDDSVPPLNIEWNQLAITDPNRITVTFAAPQSGKCVVNSSGGGGGGGGAGSVTSVSVTAPAEITLSGSPVTSSGTIAMGWANAAANVVFAGPGSGPAATPRFRSILKSDLPSTTVSTDQDNGWSGGHQDLSATLSLRLKGGAGAPVASDCNSASHVGRVYVRSDAAAQNASLYLCANTAAGNYAWELAQSTSGATVNTAAGIAGDGSAGNPIKLDSASGVVSHLTFSDSFDHGTIPTASCSTLRTVAAAGVTPGDVITVGNPVYGAGGVFAIAQPGVDELFYQVCNLSGTAYSPGNKQFLFFALRSF